MPAAPSGGWDPGLYDGKHAFVWQYGASLVELLQPQPGERVLDLGCGTGHLTARIAAAGAAVVGIDSDPAMIDQARRGYPDLHFEQQDARSFSFAEPFDAVFSNAVLHWIREPEAVIACVRRALKPGGRFYLQDVVFDTPLDRLEEVAENWVRHIAANTGYTRADGAAHVREEHSTFRWAIERLLDEAGFRIVETSQDSVYATFLAERV